jgi:hypothetical protein
VASIRLSRCCLLLLCSASCSSRSCCLNVAARGESSLFCRLRSCCPPPSAGDVGDSVLLRSMVSVGAPLGALAVALADLDVDLDCDASDFVGVALGELACTWPTAAGGSSVARSRLSRSTTSSSRSTACSTPRASPMSVGWHTDDMPALKPSPFT